MIFVLIALWVTAFLLLVSDFRSPASRRLAAVSFFGGTGALAAILDDIVIPKWVEGTGHDKLEQILYAVQAVSSVASYYGVPYFFAMFALAYRPLGTARIRKWLPWALLLPIAACLLFTPLYTEAYPIAYRVVVWWAVPYLLGGAILVATKRPVYRGFDRTHAILCLAVLPPVLLFMLLNFVLPSLGFLRMWIYNTWLVGVGFAIFLVGLFTYGFMGVRLAIERRRIDSTLRAVTSGTAILNHAIKNDVGKMRLFGEKMMAYAEKTKQDELSEDIRTLLSASRHIEEMVARVHHRTKDLALQPDWVDLGRLVRDLLQAMGTKLEGVQVRHAFTEGWRHRIDAAQVGEAIHNVLDNAVEAMRGSGELEIRWYETKRDWLLEIADTGCGMSRAEAAQAMEPFHTTKGGTGRNFGLGLPYADHVMRKHGGTLRLRSEPGVGTTVCLVFPKRAVRVERVTAIQAAEGVKADG